MNNNSFKYSPAIKALCFALSIIFFALFSLNAFCALRPLTYFSPDEVFSVEKVPYSETEEARNDFYQSLFQFDCICITPEQRQKNYESEKEKNVELVLKDFKKKKIKRIREELEYIANYNEGSVAGEGNWLTESYINSIPDTPEKEQNYHIDPYAPPLVRVACKVLNYAEGDEFLKYGKLVNEDCFDQVSSDVYLFDHECELDLSLSVAAQKDEIIRQADDIINQVEMNFSESYNSAKETVSKFVNIKYYIKTENGVLTNMTDVKKEKELAEASSFYFIKKDGKSLSKGVPEYYYSEADVIDYISNCSEAVVYMVGEDEITGDDIIAQSYNLYNITNSNIKPYIAKALCFFIISVCALVIMLNLSGHKKGVDGITLSFIDKVPGDIHFAASAALIALGVMAFIDVFFEIFDTYDYKMYENFSKPAALIPVAMWAVFIEWLASVVRTAKSEKSYFGSFLTVRIVKFIFNLLKKLFLFIKNSIENSVFRYKPKHFTWFVVVAAFVLCLIPPAGALVLTYFITKYVRNLDRVVEGSKNRESVDFGKEKVHESLTILNDSIRVSNEEVTAAVENAVKNERTKTELITNVSHDLKTPLTSIISYVDLLKSCDIPDGDAQKYIGVISEKSANLKSLIENLIEASKVSAGNVTLNRTNINLKEIVIQLVVDFSSEFEGRSLDLRFNEDCAPVTVFADGQQTYRIIENLLSNAAKYSAPNTRVYASLKEENGFGVFEIKNTSKTPLDISPEELTERFVRGDASRGEEEGNGLGLSIAKELCAIQNGRLDIAIDGDLFKATVYLPM